MEKVPVYHIIDKKSDKEDEVVLRGRRRYEAANRKMIADADPTSELIKEIQHSFIEMIDDHFAWKRTKDLPFAQRQGEEMDDEFFHFIKYQLQQILGNNRSRFLEPIGAVGIGKLGMEPFQIQLVEDAVRYRYLVKDGYLDDKSPTKTIAKYYGVSKEAVQKWCADPRFKRLVFDPYESQFLPNDLATEHDLLERQGRLYLKIFSPHKIRKD